jgi:hypothetical protein
MMNLFLNGVRVFSSSEDNIKLTRENSLITNSGDYTFEVSLPLDIHQNKLFFGAWDRIDVTKKNEVYAARMYVDNICIINGSAKVMSHNLGYRQDTVIWRPERDQRHFRR